MNLSEEEGLFMTFDDGEWHMYPNIGMTETDDGYDIESYDIDEADEVEVKEGQGYIVYLTDDVDSFGLRTSEDEYDEYRSYFFSGDRLSCSY